MAESATKTTESIDFAKQGNKSAPAGNRGPKTQKDSLAGRSSQCAGTTQTGLLYTAKVKRAQLILFATQLSVMLDSGVVLSDALDAIAGQAEQGALKMIIMEVSEKVKGGDSFSKALADYPRVFNSMFISMVRASEASGKMAEMLEVLSGYLNFESETRKRIKGALTYPFIMALMAVAATGTLMFFVLPRFMNIYEARGASLPKLTQVLVNFSRVLGDAQAMAIILTVIIFTSTALYFWSGTLTGRRIIDFVKIRTPVLGTMFIDMVVTRSMRIMATMVNTGVSLLDAIEVMQGSCENYHFQWLWAETDKKIRDGYQLSESIQISQSSEGSPFHKKSREIGEDFQMQSGVFGTGAQLIAPGVIQMLRAGEKSGRLGEVCDKISIFYEKKLEASIRNTTALIEPLMIAVMGGIIGTIAIALLLPVFRISTIIAH
jgi:type IV pilus assembly protein PilC